MPSWATGLHVFRPPAASLMVCQATPDVTAGAVMSGVLPVNRSIQP
jgi:hypothetical protein